ncbi:MAG: hypothetical protein P9M13_10470 [Candidatus Ancaeobacter aquaticus]|nr:hypothetical protein [Candidatus Ancaeobacter aquaticus]
MKAVTLLSGGLDSILAAKLIIEQGIDVYAVTYVSTFSSGYSKKTGVFVPQRCADMLGIPLLVREITPEMTALVKDPPHGHGKNLNPCIDCKIIMIRDAKKYMHDIDAQFLITGEVLGERPMSQMRHALEEIEKEGGVEGILLRPLTAHSLPETIPEKEGWVDRSKLCGITGRSRKPQFELCERFGITEYATPAGGCLLTDRGYSRKLQDAFDNNDDSRSSIDLLKTGRHFRLLSGAKIIVGRDEKENEKLTAQARSGDMIVYIEELPGPVVLVCHRKDHAVTEEDIDWGCRFCAYYSDSDNENNVTVICQCAGKEDLIEKKTSSIDKETVDSLRVGQ